MVLSPSQEKEEAQAVKEESHKNVSLDHDAAAWLIYKMSCQVEIFCHQTRRMLINLWGPYCCHQAFAAQAKTAPGSNNIHFDSGSYIIGVDVHASYCIGNYLINLMATFNY